MKADPDILRRAAMLAEALEELPWLREQLQRDEPSKGYSHRALTLMPQDIFNDGGTSEGHVEIDIETARKLIPLIEQLLRDELALLGIDA